MNLEDLNQFLINKHVWIILLTIIISIILLRAKDRVLNRAIRRIEQRDNSREFKREITYIKLAKHIINYVIIIIAFLFILQLLGFNVSSLIAGLGVVSVIGTDMFTPCGIQLPAENLLLSNTNVERITKYVGWGDIIKIGDVEGKVIELGVKSTKLKDVNNDNIFVIANRNISQSLRLSDQLVVDVPVSYDEPTEKIEKLIDIMVEQISQCPNIKGAKYLGISEFKDSSVAYRIMIYCSPEYKLASRRYALRIIKLTLDANNIIIPYNQLDIHQK